MLARTYLIEDANNGVTAFGVGVVDRELLEMGQALRNQVRSQHLARRAGPARALMRHAAQNRHAHERRRTVLSAGTVHFREISNRLHGVVQRSTCA